MGQVRQHTTNLKRALLGQFEVTHALMLRETRTRYGAHEIGFAWAILEPALMILTFYMLFTIGHRKTPPGMDLFGFIATGIIPYVMFQHSVVQVSQSIAANQALLRYPQVSVLDVVFARTCLEFVTYTGVFLVLMGGSVLIQQEFTISDPLLLMLGLLLACLLGASLGLIFCTLAQISNFAYRALSPFLRPFFWVSGIFFTAKKLPGHLRHWFLYNPVLHATELARAGWYTSYDDRYVSISYIVMWILGLALVGLTLEIIVRRRIEVT